MSDLGSQADSPNNLEQSVALIIEMQYDPALAIGTERAASQIIALVLEEAAAKIEDVMPWDPDGDVIAHRCADLVRSLALPVAPDEGAERQ